MKAIINGLRYNTETATQVADMSPNGYSCTDFRYEDTWLYRTPRGNWFLAGEGGPLTRWARSVGQSGRTNGSGIRPVDNDEARVLLEQQSETAEIEKYFGTSLEDA